MTALKFLLKILCVQPIRREDESKSDFLKRKTVRDEYAAYIQNAVKEPGHEIIIFTDPYRK